MGEYRLSRQVEADLLEILESTTVRFGAYQAHAYLTGLERTFGLLADFPRMGRSADELAIGYRRFRFQSHHIFYTEETSYVLIRALIHARMDLRPDLLD